MRSWAVRGLVLLLAVGGAYFLVARIHRPLRALTAAAGNKSANLLEYSVAAARAPAPQTAINATATTKSMRFMSSSRLMAAGACALRRMAPIACVIMPP